MTVRIQFTGDGLLDPDQLKAWTKSAQQQIHRAVRRGMYDAKPEIERKLAVHLADKLKVSRASFAKSMRGYIAARDPDKMPVMALASKVGWLGVHEDGANINAGGKGVLIPINVKRGKRIGMQAFQKVIAGLVASGNLYFKKIGGKVLAYAETLPDNNFELGKFNRRVGADRHKKRGKSKEIPIAVLVPRVHLKRRLDLNGLSISNFGPLLAEKIQARLETMGLDDKGS